MKSISQGWIRLFVIASVAWVGTIIAIGYTDADRARWEIFHEIENNATKACIGLGLGNTSGMDQETIRRLEAVVGQRLPGKTHADDVRCAQQQATFGQSSRRFPSPMLQSKVLGYAPLMMEALAGPLAMIVSFLLGAWVTAGFRKKRT